MKKLSLLLILLFISSSVFAESYFAPEWSEFCPRKYRNLDTSTKYFNKSKAYWSERKQMFDKRVAKCNSLPEESQNTCFSSLREIETKATEARAQEVRNNTLKYMLINSMY